MISRHCASESFSPRAADKETCKTALPNFGRSLRIAPNSAASSRGVSPAIFESMTRPFSFVRLYFNAPRKPFPLTNLAIIRFVPRHRARVASVTLPPSVAAKTHRPRSLRNLRSLCARSDSGSQQGGQAQRSAPYSRAERAEKEAGAKEQPRAAIVQASCSFAPPSDAGRRTHPTKPARRWSSHEARRGHLWGDLLCASW